ncbi:MAG TPA: hypothetical protein VND99_00415 [Candidatus Acidoferrales bacterium]|nr:hypothetical protein [Candidatus Acidoferrales bacterium]
MNSGTPTASIAATPASGTTNGLSLSANGTIQSLNNNTLTIGGATTGDIQFQPDGSTQNLYLTGSIARMTSTGGRILELGTGDSGQFAHIGTVSNNTFQILTNNARVASFGTNGGLALGASYATNNTPPSNGLIVQGAVGLGSSSPLAELDVRATLATTPVTSISGTTTFANTVIDQSGSGDLFTASKSGATKFTILNNGNIQINNLATGVVQSGSTGILSSAALNLAGGASYITGILPVANGGSPFEQNNGAINERITNQDLLLGGISTASAKFAVINVNSGTPTASISAANGNNAAYLTGTGVLGTTNAQTLQLGNGSTGNVSLVPGGTTALTALANGNVGIGTSLPSSSLDVAVNNSQTASQPLLLEQAGTGDTGLELKTPVTSFYVGVNAGSSTFTINSALGAANSSSVLGQNYSSVSPNSTDTNTNFAQATSFTAGLTGTISQLNVAFDTRVNGSSTFSVAIYSNNAGAPGTLLGKHTGTATVTTPTPGSTNWNTLTLDSPVSVTNGTTYWLAFQTNDASDFKARTGTGSSAYRSGITPGTWANWTSMGSSVAPATIEYGIYATITGINTDNFANGLFQLTQTGQLTLKNEADSTSAFSIENAAATALFVADTTDQRIGIGTIAPAATLDINGTSGTTPVLNISGNTAKSALIVNNTGTGDLFSASASGVTKFTLTKAGGIALSGSQGSLGNCLESGGAGGAVSWVACAGGQNYWQSATSGSIEPYNNTVDLLVGGTSTASAKFGFINVNSGTPTASISAANGNNAAYLTGTGVLGTTNAQTLTLGSASTGNIIVNPRNSTAGGYVAPATDNVTDLGASMSARFRNLYLGPSSLHIQCTVGNGCGQPIDYAMGILTSGTGINNLVIGANGNSNNPNGGLTIAQGGYVGIGTTNPLALFSVGSSSQFQVNSSGAIAAATGITSSGTIMFSNLGGQGVVQSDSNGVLSSGALNLAGGASYITSILPVANGGSPFEQNNGAINERITNQDLLLGGVATKSAKFAFINVNSGTPIASISANSSNNAVSFSGSGAIQTTNGQSLTLNGNGVGDVGIGTTAPSAKLEINSGTSGLSGLKFSQITSSTSQNANYSAILGIDSNGNVGISAEGVALSSQALAYWDGQNDPTVTGQSYPLATVQSLGSTTYTPNFTAANGEQLTNQTTNETGDINWNFSQVPYEEVQFQFKANPGGASPNGADSTWFYSFADSAPTTEYGAGWTGSTKGYLIYFSEYHNCVGISWGPYTDGNQCVSGGGAAGDPLKAAPLYNVADGNFHKVDIQLLGNQIIVRWDNHVVLTYTDVYTRDTSATNFGFASRTGGRYDNHYIKSLLVTKLGTNTSQYYINQVSPLASGLYWNNGEDNPSTTTNTGALGINVASPTATLESEGTLQINTPVYNAGTACQGPSNCATLPGAGSNYTASNTVYGQGTTWTSAMIGDIIIMPDGSRETITGFTSATQITVSGTAAVIAPGTYGIYRPNSLVVDASGNTALGGNLTTAGNLSLSNSAATTTFGGITYTWPTGGQANGYALTTNGSGTLSWTSVPTGTNPWDLQNNAIIPKSSVYDLLLGGTATSSAKFGVLNMAAGTPVASISANSNNIATYLTGNGTLGTTKKQTLTLGSTSTGNVAIAPAGSTAMTVTANGDVGIGKLPALDLTSGATILATGSAQFTSFSGSGLVDCGGAVSVLKWSAATKTFSCGSAVGQVKSFSDPITNSGSTTNTTNYWDTNSGANPEPNLTLNDTTDSILVQTTTEVTSTTALDTVIDFQMHESTSGSAATCSDSSVGDVFGGFTSTNNTVISANEAFTVAPGTLTNVSFTVCSNSNSNFGGSAPTVGTITVILTEVNNTADIAEIYPTNDLTLQNGDVVTSDPALDNGITKATSASDSALMGVISTRPSKVIGTKGSQGANGLPVALSGRVPVKVTSLNGNIASGSAITSSNIAGFGQLQTQPGKIIGQALEGTDNWSTNSCTVESNVDYVNNFWPADDGTNPSHPCFAVPTNAVSNVPATYTQPYVYFGKVMMKVDVGYNKPNTFTQNPQANTQIKLGSQVGGVATASANSYFLTDNNNNILTNDEAFSSVIAANGTFGSLTSNTLTTATLSAQTVNLNGMTLSGSSNGISFTNSSNQPVFSLDSSGNATLSGQLNVGSIGLANGTISSDSLGNIIQKLASDTTSGTPNKFIFQNASGNNLFSLDSNGNATLSGTLTTSVGHYDVAEDYPTKDQSIAPGDILAIDQTNAGDVQKSTGSYDKAIIGVYSDKPGFRLSESNGTINGDKAVPVALTGRVPVKVSLEGGVIHKGDYLTSSSIQGVAMKATHPGQVLGKALEDFDCASSGITSPVTGQCSGTVDAFVNVTFADPQSVLSNIAVGPDGKLLVASVDTTTVTVPAGLAINGKAVTGSLNDALNALSTGVTNNTTALNTLTTKVNDLSTATQTIGTSIIDLQNNVSTVSAQVAANTAQIASNSAQIAHVNGILDNVLNLAVGFHDQVNSLAQQVASNSAQITHINTVIDQLLSFAASFHDQVNNTASQISDLSQKVNKLSGNTASPSAQLSGNPAFEATASAALQTHGNEISSLQTQVATLSGEVSGQLIPTSSSSGLMNIMDLSDRLSSVEKQILSVNMNNSLTSKDATISGTLSVLGQTTVNDLGVTGNITAGALTIRGLNADGLASINSVGDLKLQDQGAGGIDILNGKIKIDTDGNLRVNAEVTTKKINIDTSDVKSASLGTITINKGDTYATVTTSALTKNSKIFATPVDTPVAVSTQQTGKNTFIIKLAYPAYEDIKVNWWIVD